MASVMLAVTYRLEWKNDIRCPCKNQFYSPGLRQYRKNKKVGDRRSHDYDNSDPIRRNHSAKHDWHQQEDSDQSQQQRFGTSSDQRARIDIHIRIV